MPETARSLAEDFVRQHRRLSALLQDCPESAFRLRPPAEERTVAAIVEHIALTYCQAVDLALAILAGRPVPDLSADVIDRANLQFGKSFEATSRHTALADLEYQALRVRDLLGAITPEELDALSTGPVWRGRPRRVRQLLFALVIGHVETHLDSLEPFLAPDHGARVRAPVLVTGATGRVGRQVVGALTARGLRVRALVREQHQKAFPPGPAAEVVIGDFRDLPSLTAALRGVSAAFLISPTGAEQAALEANFIEAAKKSEIEGIVRISTAGAEDKVPIRLARRNRQIDQYLQASGVPFTLVQPANFYDNLLDWVGDGVATGCFSTPVAPEERFFMVDVRDVAAVAAAALADGDHEGRSYVVASPELRSLRDVADQLSQLAGRRVEYRPEPAEAFTARMKLRGQDPVLAEDLTELLCNLAAIRVAVQPRLFGDPMGLDVIAKIGGKLPISLAQFLEEKRSDFGLALA